MARYPSVAVIIPVYNEEGLEKVMPAVAQLRVGQVLIINDGSGTRLRDLAKRRAAVRKYRALYRQATEGIANVRIVEMKDGEGKLINRGKGAALSLGLSEAIKEGYQQFLTLDADLTELKVDHLRQLLSAYQKQGAGQVIGVIDGGCVGQGIGRMSIEELRKFFEQHRPDQLTRVWKANWVKFIQRAGYKLSGQRVYGLSLALEYIKLYERMRAEAVEIGYGVEAALNFLVKKMRQKTVVVKWQGVGQVMKEEKWQQGVGLKMRTKMYQDILITWWATVRMGS